MTAMSIQLRLRHCMLSQSAPCQSSAQTHSNFGRGVHVFAGNVCHFPPAADPGCTAGQKSGAIVQPEAVAARAAARRPVDTSAVVEHNPKQFGSCGHGTCAMDSRVGMRVDMWADMRRGYTCGMFVYANVFLLPVAGRVCATAAGRSCELR